MTLLRLVPLCCVLACLGLAGGRALGAPANDFFSTPTVLSGKFGSITDNNTGATAEAGEPSHAGVTPKASLWYQWVATADGPVEFDTFGSSIDTVLAVYTGTNVARLNLVVANDDVNPANPQSNLLRNSNIADPYVKNPYLGPSGVKFNAKLGTTYYIAVDGYHKGGSSPPGTGPFVLSWAYNSSGVFRFAADLFNCSESESVTARTVSTRPSAKGARITVTRLFGTSGKVIVPFGTVDGIATLADPFNWIYAAEGTDYTTPANTNLVFEDGEITKSFIIPIIDDGVFLSNGQRFGTCAPNRSFNVVLGTPRLDPLEDPTVLSLPRTDANPAGVNHSSAQVDIYDFDTDPSFADPTLCPAFITKIGSATYYGFANPERMVFRCTEDVGTASILIYPIGGDATASCEIHYAYDVPLPSLNANYNSFDLQAGSDYATPDNDAPPFNGSDGALSKNPDFTRQFEDVGPGSDNQRQASANNYGTLKWEGNSGGRFTPRSIRIPINNDGLPEFNEDISIVLFDIAGHMQDMDIGYNSSWVNVGTPLTILYNDYPAGALDDAHNPDFSISSDPPNNSTPGSDGPVYALAVQADNKTIIGGNFASYDATPRNGIARIDQTGQLDFGFDPGSAFGQSGDFVSSVSLAPGGKIVVGGSFSSFNGTPRYNIAQLNPDGSLDTSFNPGTGANDNVWAVKALPNGQVLIAGDFTSVNGLLRKRVARLNADGSVDTTFDPGVNGPNATVNALDVAADGSVYIGGEFTSVGGLTRNSIAHLGTNGVPDATFDPITGVDGPVFALAIQTDGKIVIGGAFANIQSRHCGNIARFNTDGTLDATFDTGSGADDAVYTISFQSDGRIFIGGLFTSFSGTRRVGVARLYASGAVDTHWLDTAYCQFAGLHKGYFNPYVEPKEVLFATGVQSDGKVMIAGSFHHVGGGRFSSAVNTNSPGPVDDLPQNRSTYRTRYNVARLLGGDTEGPGAMSLASSSYSASENQSFLFVKLARADGTLGTIESTFSIPPRTAGPGVAQSGVDYIYNRVNPFYDVSWTGTRMQSDGLSGTNNAELDIFGAPVPNSTLNDVYVTVPHIPGVQGDRSLPFKLDMASYADVFFLGGENIPLGSALGRSVATMTILEADALPGVISFSSPAYSVNKNGTNAVISLIRTNGSSGQVTVRFATTNGTATAGPGHEYLGVTNTVTLRDGQTGTNVLVPIIPNSVVDPADKTVNLYLANPGNGATLGLSNAVLSIVDNNFLPGHINLTSTSYSVPETAGALTVTVTRSGGSLGVENVNFATTDLTATNFNNYIGTNGVLHWDDGDSAPRNIVIPIIDDGLVTPDKQFRISLFNSSVTNGLGPRTNALVTIVNQDFYGSLQFSAPSYIVNEDGGYETITVLRVGGSAGTVTANYSTADSANAFAGVNYTAVNGTVAFGPGIVSQSFNVPILDDGFPDGSPFFFNVNLSSFSAATPGSPTNAAVNILDAQSFNQPPGDPDQVFGPPVYNDDVLAVALQPAGKIVAVGNFTTASGLPAGRLSRLFSDGSQDSDFLSALAGANDSVRAVINQTDTRLVVGGAFTTMNSVVRNRITRLNYDGSLDSSFNPGSGADAPVFALAETFINGARKLMVGGSFITFNGALRSGIVRLNDDGTVDTSFNNGAGANGVVYAVAVYPTNSLYAGRIVIGGDFTAVNGVPRNRIARLNLDGTLDISFNPGAGADNTVRAVTLQSDGRVLIGGAFTNVNNVATARLARLNGNGSVDNTFHVGPGANDTVFAITLQPDNRIVVGGQFTRANGVTRNRITRLMPDGSVDPSINFGSGANSFVAAAAIQPDGKIVIGGGFTSVNGVPAGHLARLYGGSVVGSGSFKFDAANYQADETGTNILVNILRTGGTSGPLPDGSGDITVDFFTSDGTAYAGINYSNVMVTLDFPPGETLQTVAIPLIHDNQITPDLTVNLSLANPAPPASLGAQPTAVLTILNDDSSVSFSSATYSRPENAIDGLATVHLLRTGTVRNSASIEFETTTNGTAVPGLNYTPVTNVITFLPNQTDLVAQIPIFHDPAADGDKTVTMELVNPVGILLGTPSAAELTIIDVDAGPGQLAFSSPAYAIAKTGGSVTLQVTRTNGHSGVVSAAYFTADGTASGGVRYIPTNGVVSFGDGESSKLITVGVINDNIVLGDQFFTVNLTNVTGGAALIPPSSAMVTVHETDAGLSFSSSVYVTSETTPQITLMVLRPYGTNAISTISYATTNGTALASKNFVAANGVLTFNPGETFKTLTLNVLHDTNVTGNLSFGVNLSNPSNGQLIYPSSASIVILDAEAGLSFANSNLTVLESGTNVVLTVACSNPNVEPITVHYATADGTGDNPALAGVDYVPVSGFISFTNGITTNTFAVPIIHNTAVGPDRSFAVNLSNPSAPGVLVPPTTATVTILNDNSGLSFSSAAYDIFKNGVSASINVIRTGYTNSTASVSYYTQDGSGFFGATNGVDYVGTSGTLTFTNGQTSTNFSVTVIDSTVIKPNRTLSLVLSNAVGNASLVTPSTATLTIHDNSGSLIVPAGSLLTSESLTQNNAIEPGETVTLLFALRNAGGTNTGNLVATLQATNGITSPSGAQSYGSLVVDGPSASRSFSFTANGTNGQVISATFALQDGAINRGTAVFNYVLGTSSSFIGNTNLIVINDNTNATPYPSTIVSGVGGSITKATVTLSNMTHFFPSDIAALVLSPAGQKLLLMANSGSAPVSNVWLTFDDSAATALPVSGQITSGTYRPNGQSLVTTFPSPAPPAPYANTLSTFNNTSPNGTWSLFVLDDHPGYSGVISNGWALNLSTLNSVATAADLLTGVGVTSTTTVSNLVYRISLSYTISVTNFGPGTASSVSVTDTFPTNGTLVSASPAGYTLVSNVLTFTNIGSLAKDAFTTLNVTVSVPAVASVVSNTVAVLASSPADPNLANNAVTVLTSIAAPTADLSVNVSAVPDPLLLGDTLRYTLITSNSLNFSPAGGVMLTNTLSPFVGLLSNSPAASSINGNVLVFNLGTMASGAKTTNLIYVRPLLAGTITNSASVFSILTDPFKANNFASVKTVVEQFSANRFGNTIILSWPSDVGNYVLLTTTNLHAPNWTIVTNQVQNLIPGFNTVTLGTTNGSTFFRLQKQ